MSERGSFVTEYIYCFECRAATKKVLSEYCNIIEADAGSNSIIAGQIVSTYMSGELIQFEYDYMPELEKAICHPLRVVVLADNGDGKIFYVCPADQGESASCALDKPSENM